VSERPGSHARPKIDPNLPPHSSVSHTAGAPRVDAGKSTHNLNESTEVLTNVRTGFVRKRNRRPMQFLYTWTGSTRPGQAVHGANPFRFRKSPVVHPARMDRAPVVDHRRGAVFGVTPIVYLSSRGCWSLRMLISLQTPSFGLIRSQGSTLNSVQAVQRTRTTSTSALASTAE